MSYIDYLKKQETYTLDKYILLLLSLGYTVDGVRAALDISRPTVYAAIKRNRVLVDKFDITTSKA